MRFLNNRLLIVPFIFLALNLVSCNFINISPKLYKPKNCMAEYLVEEARCNKMNPIGRRMCIDNAYLDYDVCHSVHEKDYQNL